MKRSLAWWLAASLFLMAACQNTTRKTSADELIKEAVKSQTLNAGTGTFEIRAPDGWQKMDTTFRDVKVTLLTAPPEKGSLFQANMSVITESMNGVSLDTYFNQNLANMGKFMQGYATSGNGSIDVNGVPSKWIQYSQSPNGRNLDAIVYMIPGDGIAYVITCTTIKGKLDQYRPLFNQALNTFRIHK